MTARSSASSRTAPPHPNKPLEHTMTALTLVPPVDPAVIGAANLDAEFDLDLRVSTDALPGISEGCGTDDGCDPTCASSCISNA
jgi:FxLD family lantipeptide